MQPSSPSPASWQTQYRILPDWWSRYLQSASLVEFRIPPPSKRPLLYTLAPTLFLSAET